VKCGGFIIKRIPFITPPIKHHQQLTRITCRWCIEKWLDFIG